jgi:hypothetical protein
MLIVDLKDSAELKRRKNSVFVKLAEDTLSNALTITIIIIIVSIRRLTPMSTSQKFTQKAQLKQISRPPFL